MHISTHGTHDSDHHHNGQRTDQREFNPPTGIRRPRRTDRYIVIKRKALAAQCSLSRYKTMLRGFYQTLQGNILKELNISTNA